MPDNPRPPIDPLNGARVVLQGRAVTMDSRFKVVPRARVYIDRGSIVAVQDSAKPAPAGFDDVAVLDTKGTLYPGLIELHNHLAYNLLQLWKVPKKYSNRDQWAGTPEYRRLISGPMQIVGKTPELLPALTRYVEAKCLLSGVTTSQGIAGAAVLAECGLAIGARQQSGSACLNAKLRDARLHLGHRVE